MFWRFFIFGEDHEAQRIKNRHSEEMARIEAMKDKNEAEAELKRFAQENGYKLDLKRIELEFEKTRLEHERKVTQMEFEREHKKDLADIERMKAAAYDKREMEKIYKDHEINMKKMSIDEAKSRRR